MPPTVSVIIPTYNHRDYVSQTLASVFAQTFTDFEVIVVNDDSPDDTAEVLRPWRERGAIRYVEQPNAGVAAARNRGLREARGEFVALLDDDDLWPADKLEWQVAAMLAEPALAGIGGGLWQRPLPMPPRTGTSQIVTPDAGHLLTLDPLFASNPFTSPGQLLFRRAAIERVAGFDPDVWGVDDFELYLKLTTAGLPIRQVDRPALYYRLHASNASRQVARMFDNCRLCVERRLADVPDAQRPRLRKLGYRMAYGYAGWKLVRAGDARRVVDWIGHGFLTDPTLGAKLVRDLVLRFKTPRVG